MHLIFDNITFDANVHVQFSSGEDDDCDEDDDDGGEDDIIRGLDIET